MIHKGKDTVVRLPEDPRYDPPYDPPQWGNLLRDAVKLREAWKLYAIALREQNERLEEYFGNLREYGGLFEDSDQLGGEKEIENGRGEIAVLRHGVVIAGDPE